MRPDDIRTDEASTPQGTVALRNYLEYARSRILPSITVTSREPDSDFEIAVAKVLRERGYEVQPQLGVKGFFIDIAVKNPDRPGEFLAAVECDGATYHSSFSARDRDRIRQEILESLGWKDKIYRIWSADWFSDPDRQTNKLMAFLDARRAESKAVAAAEFEISDEIDAVIGSPSAPSNSTEPPFGGQEAETAGAATTSDDALDVYVEVGDKVTYCFEDLPEERHCIWIVEGPSIPKHNIVNEKTPLGIALLGLSVGERGKLEVEKHPPRVVRITKIERGNA